jgi:hypothetical protein
MLNRLVAHARRNVVAYIALIVSFGALTGTGYAALSLANHSITPPKFDRRYIGGYVRAWISVNAGGHVTASAGGFRLRPQPDIGAGHYAVDWHPNPASRCTTVGNVSINAGPSPGYLVTDAFRVGSTDRVESVVQVYNALGQPAALPFTLVLVCGTPR